MLNEYLYYYYYICKKKMKPMKLKIHGVGHSTFELYMNGP